MTASTPSAQPSGAETRVVGFRGADGTPKKDQALEIAVGVVRELPVAQL
jgi:hypothetical protein